MDGHAKKALKKTASHGKPENEYTLKQGYLTSSNSATRTDNVKDWSKRYYVLFPHSEKNKARLDWFPDENAFNTSPLVRKTIYIEEMTSVSTTAIDGKQHCFEINTLRRNEPFLFSADAKKEMKTWVDQLHKLLEEQKKKRPQKNPKGGDSHLGDGVYGNELWTYDETPEKFTVRVEETDSARGCNLAGETHILEIYSQALVLTHLKTDETLYVWPYKYIRRYGKGRETFTFEAGRRCASGEGLFILNSDRAEDIFNEVQRGNANNDKFPHRNPEIPSRSYGHHFGEIVIQEKKVDPNRPVPSIPPSGIPQRGMPSPKVLPEMAGARLPAPLICQVYAEPARMTYDDADTYSSIEEDSIARITGYTSTDDGYSTPVTEDTSSMSAIAAQIRLNNNSLSNDDTNYDAVHLNVMKQPSNLSASGQDVYSELYHQIAPNVPAKKVEVMSDIYDEVGSK